MNMNHQRWGIVGNIGEKFVSPLTRKKYLGEIILEVAWKIEN